MQSPHPRVTLFETELALSGFSITAGLSEGGSRGYIHRLVTDCFGVLVDGFVQRIPVHDLKVVLRGSENDIDFVTNQIRSSLSTCQIEVKRRVSLGGQSILSPTFKILRSASREAIKSDLTGDSNDNKFSVRSGSTSLKSEK